jgi:hypothetical protein
VSAPPNRGCTVLQSMLFGNAAPGPASQGSTWVDGQGGHAVSCSVSGDGTYTFSGDISSSGSNGRFNIYGTVQAGGTGTAQLSVFVTGALGGISLYDPNCTVTATGEYKVEKGAIWAGLSCSKLQSGDDTYQWCSAIGTFIFKSCSS